MSSVTIGLDLGDRYSRYCTVDAAGAIQQEGRVRTTQASPHKLLADPTVICAVGGWLW